MFHVSIAAGYFSHKLSRAGYLCLEAKGRDAMALVAGKDGAGFLVVFEWAAAIDQPEIMVPTSVLRQLSHIKLPLRRARISPVQHPATGRSLLLVRVDDTLKALLEPADAEAYGLVFEHDASRALLGAA